MTISLPQQVNLLLKEESIFDNVYKDIKGLIKSRMDILTKAIEQGKAMDKEERVAYHELFVEESKSLIQRLQDVNDFLKEQKKRLENFDNERREIESKELWNAANINDLLKAKALLKKGNADINWENPEWDGYTALMRAVCYDYLDMARLLITNKADVNLRDEDQNTPLLIALHNLEITKLLVANGAKVDDQDKYGDTALNMACQTGFHDVASFLLAEGAAYTFENRWGLTAGDYALDNGWNWNPMIAKANLSYYDHVFDCMINADYSALVEKKRGRKRKRGEKEVEKKEELPFLLRFMKKVVHSDFMMSKNVFPKLSFNPGAEAGEGIQEFEELEVNSEEDDEENDDDEDEENDDDDDEDVDDGEEVYEE